MESRSASALGALLTPVHHLKGRGGVAVVCPVPLDDLLVEGWERWEASADEVRHVVAGAAVVLGDGNYLPWGRVAYDAAVARGIPYHVVQHGLLTPLAPPLPPGARLLAYSQADADFWRSGRADVTTSVVGSQLFYDGDRDDATRSSAAGAATAHAPVFLGQLHGAELPRREMVQLVEDFCRSRGAQYRPHPAETDRASRLTHKRWRRSGIRVDDRRSPLAEAPNPVVSIFSTGVLEAAAAGIPAWVYHPDPPSWLRDFWTRYGMREWGPDRTPGPATPPPPIPDVEPAARVAAVALEHLERT